VYVEELYVEPGARGEGVGGRLLEAVRAWAEEVGADRIRIGVLSANADGLRFWTQQGARALAQTLTIELEGRPAPAQKARGKLGF
jgi:GNAT superfamily N-acetyltransferase